jgi:hypothetical protein
MDDPLTAEAELVAALRLTAAPPAAWVEAAALIPETLGDLDALERLVDTPEFRERFAAAPEHALQQAGLDPSGPLLDALHERLG